LTNLKKKTSNKEPKLRPQEQIVNMPKLIYHDLKSTQRKTNLSLKGNNNNNNNNNSQGGENQRPKPAKPQVKSLKYVDLVVRWRKKTADSNKRATENPWDDVEESIRRKKEGIGSAVGRSMQG